MPRCKSLLALALTLMISGILADPAPAQWTTQTITLQPGWNAVYLEVQPEPRDTTAVLSGIPVESIWMWNKRFTSVEFLESPDQLIPERPEWLQWFVPGSSHAEKGGARSRDERRRPASDG